MKVNLKQNFDWQNKEFVKETKRAWGIVKRIDDNRPTLKQIFLIRNKEGNLDMLASDGYRLFVRKDWNSFDLPFKTRAKTLSLKIEGDSLITDRLKIKDRELLDNLLKILDGVEKAKKQGLMLNLKEPLKRLEKFNEAKKVVLELKKGKTYLRADDDYLKGKAEFLLQDNNDLPKLNLKIAFNASYVLSLLNGQNYTILSFTENPLQPFLIDGSLLMPMKTIE